MMRNGYLIAFCRPLIFGGTLMLALMGSAGCSDDDKVVTPVKRPEPVKRVDNATAYATQEMVNTSTLKIALNEPFNVERVELATEALEVWRRYAALSPTMLLLSDEPMLLPVPPNLSAQIEVFVATAPASELARRSHPKTADVLLMPDMTIDIALRQHWLGQLAWVLPLRDPEQPLALESFRKRLTETGLATDQEVATLAEDQGRLRGMLRETPFEAGVLEKLPAISGPAIIHIDLSYFRNLYKNDVATPVLNLVFETLTKLRDQRVPVLAVTLSYGNLTERVALDVRFLGEVIAELFAHPEMFEQPVPANWERQGQLLYLNSFFQTEKQLELALAQEKNLPEAAWVKFNLYQVAATDKQGAEALNYLAEAVTRDKVYAMEYLSLADMAYEEGRPDEALRMLKLADLALPENPMIRLRMALLSGELGDRQTALHLVRQLQVLPWSSFYQGPLIEYINGFAAYLETETGQTAMTRPRQKSVRAPVERPSRILHTRTDKVVMPATGEPVLSPEPGQLNVWGPRRVLHPQPPQTVAPAKQ